MINAPKTMNTTEQANFKDLFHYTEVKLLLSIGEKVNGGSLAISYLKPTGHLIFQTH